MNIKDNTAHVQDKKTIVPRNIASDIVKRRSLGGKVDLVVLGVMFVLACFKPAEFMPIFILACIFIYLTRSIFNSVAHEVIDTGTDLMITTDKVQAKIAYVDILNIEYSRSFILYSKYVVKLTIKSHDKLGNTIRFIGWADNYGITQSAETLAWIASIKEKANL